MSLSGTDLLSLACILGGASVGGAATVAALDASSPSTESACAAVAVSGSPRLVVMKGGSAHTVVLSQSVHGPLSDGCLPALGREIEIRVESARIREEVQVRLEKELGRLQEELQSHQAEIQARQQELQARQQELQSRQQELPSR